MACLILFHFLDSPSGSPLSVVLVSATDSAFFRMQFIDHWPVSADDSQTFAAAKVHLLVSCKSGAIHTVTTERGTRSCTMQLTDRLPEFDIFPYLMYTSNFFQSNEVQNIFTHYFLYLYRPKDCRALPTVTVPVQFLQNLVKTQKLLIKS